MFAWRFRRRATASEDNDEELDVIPDDETDDEEATDAVALAETLDSASPPVRCAARPAKAGHRQPPKPQERGDSWWVGVSREDLNAMAIARAPAMSRSTEGRLVKGLVVGDI